MKIAPRLLAVMRKELLQLKRDRLTFAMIVGIPVMQMLLFGYAINTDVRNLKSAVANQANTHLSRQFIAELGQTQVLDLRYVVDTPQEIEALRKTGEISIGIFIPPDFDRRVNDDRRAAAHLMVDAVDPTVLGVANQLRNMPLKFDSTVSPPAQAGTFEVRPYFNPERRSAVFVIPGLMGIILTLTMMLFTAVAVVREREHGNLELLINTPVSTTELMIGKVIPYIVIGIVQLALIISVGRILFKVPVLGSILDLYLAASVFIAANLALGLFVSTIVKTQFQAIQITFFILLPSILISGFVFPFDGMPRAVQYLGEVLPTTHFMRLTRGIMLRDAPLGDMYQELLALGVFALVAMTAATIRFSRRLDLFFCCVVVWPPPTDGERHGDVQAECRNHQGKECLLRQDLILHIGNVYHDKRELSPAKHAESDHQALVKAHATGIAGGQPRGTHLHDQQAEQQHCRVRQNFQQQVEIEDYLRAEIDEEHRPDPGKGSLVDDVLRFRINAFGLRSPSNDATVITELKIFLLDDQSGHVCTDRRMESETGCDQSDDQRQQQNGQRRVPSFVKGKYMHDPVAAD